MRFGPFRIGLLVERRDPPAWHRDARALRARVTHVSHPRGRNRLGLLAALRGHETATAGVAWCGARPPRSPWRLVRVRRSCRLLARIRARVLELSVAGDGRCAVRTRGLLLVRDPGGAQELRAEGAEPSPRGADGLAALLGSGCFSERCVTGVARPPRVAKGGDEKEPPRSFAVMEDGSVLCAGCAHEATGAGAAAAAGTIVHAWVDRAPGVCCGWCGEDEWSA
jgi:hypothetical protein